MWSRTALLWFAAGCGRFGFAPGPDPADTGTSPAAYAEVVLADRPLAYYRFGEPGGATAFDSSGHGHDAEYRAPRGGTIVWGRPGAVIGDTDTAVEFYGEGNAGNTSGACAFFPIDVNPWAGDFSVEAWLQPSGTSLAGWSHALFLWEDYLVSGFRLGWDPALTLRFWTDEGGGSTDVHTVASIRVNAFNHVVLVRTGSEARLYLDGVEQLVTPIDYVAPVGDPDRGAGSLHGMPSDGIFDELAIYAEALSPARIAAHYQAAGAR